jgi:hypothetical protein
MAVSLDELEDVILKHPDPVVTTGDLADAEGVEVVDEIIQRWRPGRSADERGKRRRAGREALLWLRSQNGPVSRADFESALYDDEIEPTADTWWRKWVRPALKHADHAGKVEYRMGHHDYEWTGE